MSTVTFDEVPPSPKNAARRLHYRLETGPCPACSSPRPYLVHTDSEVIEDRAGRPILGAPQHAQLVAPYLDGGRLCDACRLRVRIANRCPPPPGPAIFDPAQAQLEALRAQLAGPPPAEPDQTPKGALFKLGPVRVTRDARVVIALGIKDTGTTGEHVEQVPEDDKGHAERYCRPEAIAALLAKHAAGDAGEYASGTGKAPEAKALGPLASPAELNRSALKAKAGAFRSHYRLELVVIRGPGLVAGISDAQRTGAIRQGYGDVFITTALGTDPVTLIDTQPLD
jgi:hypothetical protein